MKLFIQSTEVDMSNQLDSETERLLDQAEEAHLRETGPEIDDLENWRARSETESRHIYIR